jgi:hypothetical protein
MKMVDTVVKEDRISYTWERDTVTEMQNVWTKSGKERCTVTIGRYSQDSGIPARDDPRWKVVE